MEDEFIILKQDVSLLVMSLLVMSLLVILYNTHLVSDTTSLI